MLVTTVAPSETHAVAPERAKGLLSNNSIDFGRTAVNVFVNALDKQMAPRNDPCKFRSWQSVLLISCALTVLAACSFTVKEPLQSLDTVQPFEMDAVLVPRLLKVAKGGNLTRADVVIEGLGIPFTQVSPEIYGNSPGSMLAYAPKDSGTLRRSDIFYLIPVFPKPAHSGEAIHFAVVDFSNLVKRVCFRGGILEDAVRGYPVHPVYPNRAEYLIASFRKRGVRIGFSNASRDECVVDLYLSEAESP